MKTFATTLLLLASAAAAYGHSPKASKANISNNLSFSFQAKSDTKASKSFGEPIRGRRLLGEDHVHPGGMGGGKPSLNLHHKTSMSYHLFRPRTAKTKSEKDIVLFSAPAKSEKEAAISVSASAKSSKARFGRALHKRSELDLIEGSLSLELSPRTYPKSGKASSKATVFVIDAKSSKAVPVKVKRSIDPVEVSNDQAEPMKALSFIEYSSQTPVASKEEASGASVVVASVAVGTLLAVSAFALN